MIKLSVLSLAILFLALMSETCIAQCVYRPISVSRLQGTILTRDGKPIPNVNVELKRNSDRIASATTNEAGEFLIKAVPGEYELRSEARGFAPGFAEVELGSDLVRTLIPRTHLWMILDVGMINDYCQFTTTSRSKLRKALRQQN